MPFCGRECDPDLCLSCGASYHPVLLPRARAADTAAVGAPVLCSNCPMARGTEKQISLGRSGEVCGDRHAAVPLHCTLLSVGGGKERLVPYRRVVQTLCVRVADVNDGLGCLFCLSCSYACVCTCVLMQRSTGLAASCARRPARTSS
jgi:hypothetical protein